MGDYNPNAIVSLEIYDKEYMNKADANAEGGIFIFAASKTAAKGGTVSYLEVYDPINFNVDGGYTRSFTLADPASLEANDDFVFDKLKDLAGTAFGVSADTLVDVVRLYNFSYAYFTTLGYYEDNSEEQVLKFKETESSVRLLTKSLHIL